MLNTPQVAPPKPKVKGFICVNTHPEGCYQNVDEQIAYARSQPFEGAKTALIIGCSSGYGLASRIALSFGSNTDTLGVYFDRAPSEKRSAGAGWYNNQHLEQRAAQQGLAAHSLNLDAFQPGAKAEVIQKLKATIGQVDLVIYSLASPRRYIADEDKWYNSVLKPVGQAFHGKTIDTDKGLIKPIDIEAASQDEIDATIKVMGGEDWQLWIDALNDAKLLSPEFKTIAYTYIGDEITWPIYGEATIGHAKKDLDRTAAHINRQLDSINGQAHIGVLKAIVTQSSAAIPVMPLYMSLLYRVMKEQAVHENCIEQISRILATGLYGQQCQKDQQGRLRVDEHELSHEVQSEVKRRWAIINNENLAELADFEGYKNDFLKLFGFGFELLDDKVSTSQN